MIGTTIDQYKIVERIAAGGMGEVYRAIDLELERDVAIKCVRPELADLDEATKRFRAEARTLAKLAHLNIATVYRFFAQHDRLFLVMEYIDGQPFGDMISGGGSLPHKQAVRLVQDALKGLGYAHKHNIVHRDIKPGNLMVDTEETVKVLDFGIAHLVGGTRLTRVGSVVGTPAYMAPEQILGKDIDQRTDLYAIGVVLYEMLSGNLPYAANSDFELMRAHLEAVPRPMSELSKNDVPIAIQQTVERALAKDTSDRFQSADEFVQALGDAERSSNKTQIVPPPIPTPSEPTTVAHPDADSMRKKWLPIAVAGVASIIVVVAAWAFWPKGTTEQPRQNVVIGDPQITTTNINSSSPTQESAIENAVSESNLAIQTTPSSVGVTETALPTPPTRDNALTTRTTTPASETRQATTKQAVSRPAAVPTSVIPENKVTVVKMSVHEKQGTGRFSRDAGYNGALRLSVPNGASRNVEIEEYAQVFRDGELIREQSIASEMRVAGSFKTKRRIQGLKTLEPGEYSILLSFRHNSRVIGQHRWKLLVSG